jgi:hypothetical protein
MHGLFNAPTPLFAGNTPVEFFLIVLVIGWPWLARRPPAERFTLARVEAASDD